MAELSSLLTSARAVLFDFDGPVCDVFAGLPASDIADDLMELVGQSFDTDDPLEVLEQCEPLGRDILELAEKALIAGEVRAVGSAISTPGGIASMRASVKCGRPIGIVSNNSADSVRAYLQSVVPAVDISVVVGRKYAAPRYMKPHPWPLQQALKQLDVKPADAVFIGDSMTDIEVSDVVGVRAIAFANSPEKRALFSNTNATVITDMRDVYSALS